MNRNKEEFANKGWLGFFVGAFFAPVLLSVQAIIKLYAINAAELGFEDVIRSLAISILFAVFVTWLMRSVLGDWLKASLTASLFLLIFYIFGDVSDWMRTQTGLGPVRTDFILLAFVVLLLAIWGWRVSRGLKQARLVNTYFILLGSLFFLSSVVSLYTKLADAGAFSTSSREVAVVNQATAGANRPDVYYIILDAYGRQDVLQEFYTYDNSDLVGSLESKGFYVANQSSSNYIQTMLSLTSSLNMDYLQTMIEQGDVSANRYELIDVIQHSEVRRVLSENGYQTVSFGNEYKATVPDADVFYDDARSGILHPVTAFEGIVFDHTMARTALVWKPLNYALIGAPYRAHAEIIVSTFERLQEVPELEGDYFVYAHVIAPHPPFVFDAQGNFIEQYEVFSLDDANYYIKEHSRGGYIGGYRKQIQYINTLLMETVDAILAKSDTPPIIIIQSDHGPGAYLHWGSLESTIPAERFGILNAYYFPDEDYTMLYSEITPVNSFRVVINQYFDGEYELLPDQHYYSKWSFPFEFTEVTDLSLP